MLIFLLPWETNTDIRGRDDYLILTLPKKRKRQKKTKKKKNQKGNLARNNISSNQDEIQHISLSLFLAKLFNTPNIL